MAERKKGFYCNITRRWNVCAAVNQFEWIQLRLDEAQKAYKEASELSNPEAIEAKLEDGRQLEQAATETQAEVKYCSRCPLRIK
ncbi:hypothetical protein A3A76_01090 [Candidatus Woesebacteria bacterium RIFCSPLOWO2_01_FULL_39_23]|uniref:Uncharacterized protein n=1 Tax=Candidatus Woesebacteria bacterium RIFCSPHIGHO2_01_FULL_40_22 TaxID=1802499 RepID=A0A1F7YG48_9BACT|nr:MAG: hypothetical protein A2141_04760 [Candidatus Woesebacteria bacterium RBG_16_40_11]OGM25859.1 MAG: hypothetical protein A2628_04765 [Candidatus Woesebacteria bacterium RIFCSPHIGHO2_01_FULL_40_22]OGM36237.1 MAG: hypothetical protein A3E41_02495 [Candidatus Woesebacteria bacterium RIFCSPHIGHO2_12_FULL_38_9]OGM61613.1 MAG: hypothetical protein A3A76_01090 [Candidatus Woesebacteria bacterium RIFCSPLOWO2_01_FULL_39_23]